MRQKVRRIIIYSSLFLFPLMLNYLSPYVSQRAAYQGIVAGSIIFFGLLFISGIFFGRAWCAWGCPVAGIGELGATINGRPVNRRRLAVLRYAIFGVWFILLVLGFVLAGGIKGVDPLYLTENIVSVDAPAKYIIYYFVLVLIFVLTVTIGRRGACQSVCWMAPFLTAGDVVGRALRLPQLRISAKPDACVDCGKCTARCPMSIDVAAEMKSGGIRAYDCIRCGECVDGCPKKALSFTVKSGCAAAPDGRKAGRREV